MYGFILGFQRRVWWPKWTPASKSCLIVATGKVDPLSCLVVCSVLANCSLPKSCNRKTIHSRCCREGNGAALRYPGRDDECSPFPSCFDRSVIVAQGPQQSYLWTNRA